MFEFIGTLIYSLLPKDLTNMSLPMFKEYILHWLLHEYDVTNFYLTNCLILLF